MVPFYGQGMNAGFEDVNVFSTILDATKSADGVFDINAAIQKYSESRPADAHAICDLALYNYHEMSSHVTSPLYILEKKIIDSLYRLCVSGLRFQKESSPIIPLYTMVAFTGIPYSQVISRHKRQKKWLGTIAKALFGTAGIFLITKGLGLRKHAAVSFAAGLFAGLYFSSSSSSKAGDL